MNVEVVFVLTPRRGLDLDPAMQVFDSLDALCIGISQIASDETLVPRDPEVAKLTVDCAPRLGDGEYGFISLSNKRRGAEEAVLKITTCHMRSENGRL